MFPDTHQIRPPIELAREWLTWAYADWFNLQKKIASLNKFVKMHPKSNCKYCKSFFKKLGRKFAMNSYSS